MWWRSSEDCEVHYQAMIDMEMIQEEDLWLQKNYRRTTSPIRGG